MPNNGPCEYPEEGGPANVDTPSADVGTDLTEREDRNAATAHVDIRLADGNPRPAKRKPGEGVPTSIGDIVKRSILPLIGAKELKNSPPLFITTNSPKPLRKAVPRTAHNPNTRIRR